MQIWWMDLAYVDKWEDIPAGTYQKRQIFRYVGE